MPAIDTGNIPLKGRQFRAKIVIRMNQVKETILIDAGLCGQCGACVPVCPVDAIYLSPTLLEIDGDTCTLCGDCVLVCPVGALETANG